MRGLLALAVSGLLLVPVGPAQAHAGTYDMKYVDGSNLILLTFNTHQPVSGLDIEHNIRLYDLVGAPIPYDEVDVQVHTQEATSGGVDGLQTSLRKEATLAMLATNESTLDYTYPTSGPYRLTTVFFSGGQEISRGEFAIDISTGNNAPSRGFAGWWLGVAFVLGSALTWALTWALARRRAIRPAPGRTTDLRDADGEQVADDVKAQVASVR